jgi:ribosome-associated protein YbcJ (S4-like RNA binding protein)
MQIRLNKFLAQAGVASRREVDKMIVEGRIKVNGQVVKALGSKIDDEKDKVEVEGRRVEREEGLIYLMMNKPPGYLVTLKDHFQRPTIQQLLPSLKQRVFPVGRLDYDSSGLLLMTNDGLIPALRFLRLIWLKSWASQILQGLRDSKKEFTSMAKRRLQPRLLSLKAIQKRVFLGSRSMRAEKER